MRTTRTRTLCAALLAAVLVATCDAACGPAKRQGRVVKVGAGAPCFSPAPLVADNPVVFLADESGFQSLDTLTLAVSAPRVDTRSAVALRLGSCELKTTSSQRDACHDALVAVPAWAEARACGVVRVQTTRTQDVYQGRLTASYTETAGVIDSTPVTRSVSQDIVFRVAFNKTASASKTNVHTFAPVQVAAALMDLHVDVGDDNTAITVGTAVSVDVPFELTMTGFTLPDGVGTATFQAKAARNVTSDAQHNVQEWDAVVVPSCWMCQLLGVEAVINFTVSCRADVAPEDCPFAVPQPVGFVLTLNTDNFCPFLIDTVTVSAQLATFRDAPCLEQTSAYFIGKTLFAKAALSSVVSLRASRVVGVVVSGSAVVGGSVDITDRIQTRLTDAAAPVFWFDVDPATFTVDTESFSTMSLTAFYEVDYQNTATRALSQDPAGTLSLSVTHVISLAGGSSPSAASHLSPFAWL